MSIEEEINTLATELSLFDDPMDKYEYIIELGRQLETLDDAYKTDAYRVQGCMSRVWLFPVFENGRLLFRAESDAFIVKGLVRMLLRIYSGRRPSEILQSDRALLERLGLDEIITAGRQNGVASMIDRIYGYAKEYAHG